MPVRKLIRILLIVFSALDAGSGVASSQKKPTGPRDLVTKEYSVAGITGKVSVTGHPTWEYNASPLTLLILHNVANPQTVRISNVNGRVLRITARSKQHTAIKETLEQLRRIEAIKVALNCRLVEIRKLPATTLGDKPIILKTDRAKELAKLGKTAVSRERAILVGRSAEVLSLQHTTVLPTPGAVAIVTRGIQIIAMPVVSGDRRFVSLTLAEKTFEKTSNDLNRNNLKSVSGKSLIRKTTIRRIPDNDTLVLRFLGTSDDGKDRIMLITVRILIPTELMEEKEGMQETASRRFTGR